MRGNKHSIHNNIHLDLLCVCVYTCNIYINIHIYIYIYFCIYLSILIILYLYYQQSKSNITGLILVFFLSIFVILFFDSEKSGVHYLQHICLINTLLHIISFLLLPQLHPPFLSYSVSTPNAGPPLPLLSCMDTLFTLLGHRYSAQGFCYRCPIGDTLHTLLCLRS